MESRCCLLDQHTANGCHFRHSPAAPLLSDGTRVAHEFFFDLFTSLFISNLVIGNNVEKCQVIRNENFTISTCIGDAHVHFVRYFQ